jgi:hypothetical protein
LPIFCEGALEQFLPIFSSYEALLHSQNPIRYAQTTIMF